MGDKSDSQARGAKGWLRQRQKHWRKLDELVPALQSNDTMDPSRLREVMREYPELARDVVLAQRAAPGGQLSVYLAGLYATLHRAIFRPARMARGDFESLFTEQIPAAFYAIRVQIFSVALGFVIAGVAGWWLVYTFPELAGLFASKRMINDVQAGKLWTDGLLNIMPSSVLAVQILTNNIVVALTAMALGTLYGLGTIYIIGLNGLMLGGVFALTGQYGMADELFNFVIAHGVVELSVIVIAGAAGFSIGESLARPGTDTRVVAFRKATQQAGRVLLLCVLFLFGAGLIEGFISPDPRISLGVRATVGLVYFALLIFAIRGWRFSAKSAC